jgi:hypothetical protein
LNESNAVLGLRLYSRPALRKPANVSDEKHGVRRRQRSHKTWGYLASGPGSRSGTTRRSIYPSDFTLSTHWSPPFPCSAGKSQAAAQLHFPGRRPDPQRGDAGNAASERRGLLPARPKSTAKCEATASAARSLRINAFARTKSVVEQAIQELVLRSFTELLLQLVSSLSQAETIGRGIPGNC